MSPLSITPDNDTPLQKVVKEFQFVIDFMPQMVWATRPDGYHDFFNKRWYEFTGLSYEETRDKGWSLVLHPDDYDRTWEVWKHSLETGVTYEIEYRMKRYDGTFNWFLARAQPLRNEYGEIIKWFGTCTDIQEQREILEELSLTKEKLRLTNNELTDSNKQLTRINLELDNFVYTVSHDLKAPLNNLEGLVELLDPNEKGIKQSEILGMIGNEVRRFKSVVNDMTFIVQEAKEKNKIPKIDLPKLLGDVNNDIRNLIESTGTTFKLDFQVKEFQYSRKDLRSILFNLVSNSIKYRSPFRLPKIVIRTKAVEEGIILEVEDNGCGIEAQDVPKIFEKYHRINSSVEGSGLGLFIVKRMVENKGGSITVESEMDTGTKFSVFLKPETLL